MYGISEPSGYPSTGIWIGVIHELENRKRLGVLGLPRGVPFVTVTRVRGRVEGCLFSANETGGAGNWVAWREDQFWLEKISSPFLGPSSHLFKDPAWKLACRSCGRGTD